LERRLATLHPERRIAAGHRALDSLAARRDAAMRHALDRRGAALAARAAQLHALSPLAVLERGYAMVERDGAVLADARAAAVGDRLRVRLARGALEVAVEKIVAQIATPVADELTHEILEEPS
ncbi:MAG: exodeoxyribonuclease VII large subunit, partial [Proteobacteria bacterium]|nr:exodeoxyribonuclease VII large subunit [Pseudomonadota bacterium]